MSQAQQDHEREQTIHPDVHGENQDTFEQVKVKVPPKPYEPTKEERQSREATHCPFRAWCEIFVKAKSPDGKHTKQLGNEEHILVIEFDYAFATDTLGDPNRKISMMIATESIHGSIFAVAARTKGERDDYVMQSVQTFFVIVGFGQSRVEMRPGAKHSRCGKCFDHAVSIHKSDCDCNAKRLERELGAWRTSKCDDSGTASGISRSRLSEIQDRTWT